MTVNSQIAGTLTLRIGDATTGVDVECQVAAVRLSRPRAGDPEVIRLACGPGETVSDPGDPENGQLSADLVVDHTTAGVCRFLNTHHEEQPVAFELNLDPGTDMDRTYTGDLICYAADEDWTTGKLERVTVELPILTCTVAYNPAP